MDVSHKLGTPQQECPQWLVAAPKDQLPQPERLAFTPPARDEGASAVPCPALTDQLALAPADGHFIIPRVLAAERRDVADDNVHNQNRNIWGINNNVASKKRTYEHANGVDGQLTLTVVALSAKRASADE